MIHRSTLGAAAATAVLAAAVVAGGLTTSSATTSQTKTAVKAISQFTYSKDIAPIVYQNCTSCHRDGEVAPFSLSNYDEVRRHAATMVAVTQSRYMPPWKAAPDGDKFSGERRLSDTQIATIQQWVSEGMPAGNPADLPPAPHFASGWRMGPPDAVVQPEAAYPVPADGDDVYRCFVIPTSYGEDRYLSGLEVHPGNGKIVHHIIVYLDTTGAAREREREAHDPEPGYTSFGGPGFPPSGALGGWAPGNDPMMAPPGDGILLPKGADIVMQIHYHKDGKPETDLSKIGLYFSKTRVDKRVRTMEIMQPFLYIQPGDAHYRAKTNMRVPADIHVLDVLPHMHLVGHDISVSAIPPGEPAQTLVSVPQWDFNWQTRYTFKQPVALPKGTQIDVVAHYDNTADNPRNPNTPPKLVKWGEQTTDEMCIAFVSYTIDDEHLIKGITGSSAPEFGKTPHDSILDDMMAQFDTDDDGKLDQKELANLIAYFRERNGSNSGGLLASAPPEELARRAIMLEDRDGDGKLDKKEMAALLLLMNSVGGGAK